MIINVKKLNRNKHNIINYYYHNKYIIKHSIVYNIYIIVRYPYVTACTYIKLIKYKIFKNTMNLQHFFYFKLF